ncbi:MAG: hypothetical protein GXO40_05875, partial [Epsilonproteobacteria bacterium]|nr:hypothetical protein [Campylobacterota bacterium]
MRLIVILLLVVHLFASELVYDEINSSQITSTNITENIITNNEYNLKIAVIVDKNKFFQFIPNILNTINGYLSHKDIKYSIDVFNQDTNLTKQLNHISRHYPYVFAYFTDKKNIKLLNKYNTSYFFIPTVNKNQLPFKTNYNIFFGGINYKQQVTKLNRFINGYTIIVYENTELSRYVTSLIDKLLLQPHKIKKYPIYYSKLFSNVFVYLNTKVVNTAQILANFTYHKLFTKAILTTQLNYTPLIFVLTNPMDTRNVILAN